MCYGGILCVMVVYYVLWRCNLCYGGVLYGRVVYCVLGRCTVYYGGVLCVMAGVLYFSESAPC